MAIPRSKAAPTIFDWNKLSKAKSAQIKLISSEIARKRKEDQLMAAQAAKQLDFETIGLNKDINGELRNDYDAMVKYYNGKLREGTNPVNAKEWLDMKGSYQRKQKTSENMRVSLDGYLSEYAKNSDEYDPVTKEHLTKMSEMGAYEMMDYEEKIGGSPLIPMPLDIDKYAAKVVKDVGVNEIQGADAVQDPNTLKWHYVTSKSTDKEKLEQSTLSVYANNPKLQKQVTLDEWIKAVNSKTNERKGAKIVAEDDDSKGGGLQFNFGEKTITTDKYTIGYETLNKKYTPKDPDFKFPGLVKTEKKDLMEFTYKYTSGKGEESFDITVDKFGHNINGKPGKVLENPDGSFTVMVTLSKRQRVYDPSRGKKIETAEGTVIPVNYKYAGRDIETKTGAEHPSILLKTIREAEAKGNEVNTDTRSVNIKAGGDKEKKKDPLKIR